jgi:gliding motility-associated-like protein
MPFSVFAQHALVNDGANIAVVGPGSQTGNLGVAVIGNFVNLNNGTTDGQIDLKGGHIFVTGDWTNNANNNVFTNFSGTNTDGFVTMSHPNTPQLITGTSPTYFENLIVTRSRKSLGVSNSSVNGSLFVDAIFELNANRFDIKNPSPAGIVYKSGFIKSETLPGNYGIIRWNIGSNQGIYNIPFGNDLFAIDNNLNFSIELLKTMNDSDYIDFATYPSDLYNYPLPTGASPLETEFKKVVDRYWIINTNDPLSRPDVNMVFSYTGDDLNPTNNTINPQQLKASRSNDLLGEWLDMTPVGNTVGKTVEANNISGSDLYPSWTLINLPGPLTDLFTPDAFTPNGDGMNDYFLPVFQVDFEVIKYDLYIYNRWGKEVFHSANQTEGWNGRMAGSNNEPVIGVYSWVIVVKGKSKYNTEAEGETKRYVGRVTLVK